MLPTEYRQTDAQRETDERHTWQVRACLRGRAPALVVPEFSVFIRLSHAEEETLRCGVSFLQIETQHTHTKT